MTNLDHCESLTPSRCHAAQDSHGDRDEDAPTVAAKTKKKSDRRHLIEEHRQTHATAEETSSSSGESEPEDNVPEHNRRYPLHQRRQRVVEGGIPWNAIRD